MQEVVTAFLDHLDADGATPLNTITAYRTDLIQFTVFLADRGVIDAGALQSDDIHAFADWLQTQGYATTTIARRVAALRAFGAFLVQQELLGANPADGLHRPAVSRSAPRILLPQQLDALRALTIRDATPEGWRDRAMIEVLAATALRVSDLVGLDVTDVAFDTATVKVRGKAGAYRECALSPEAVMALVTYLQLGRPCLLESRPTTTALFLNQRGQRLTRQGFWAVLQPYARQLEIDDLSPEMLRQSVAAHRLAMGASVDEVQALLGNTTRTTLQLYQQTVSLAS